MYVAGKRWPHAVGEAVPGLKGGADSVVANVAYSTGLKKIQVRRFGDAPDVGKYRRLAGEDAVVLAWDDGDQGDALVYDLLVLWKEL
jgi:hypothetical protein